MVALAAAIVLPAQPAAAVEWVVTTTDDVVDGGDGLLSLREALDAAADGDEIRLAAGESYQLTICGGATEDDANADGDLDIDGVGVIIRSDGSALATIEQTCPEERVFHILAASEVTLSRLEITGGSITGSGAGVLNIDLGFLHVLASHVTDNHSLNGNDGGGIRGQAQVNASTVSGNTADGFGGGIMATEVQMTNSTITGNGAGAAGGGIAGGELDLLHATIVGNTAPQGANIELSGDSSQMNAVTSAIGAPGGGGDDCLFSGDAGTALSAYSVDSDGTCGLDDPTDLAPAADLDLGALADNGGLTPTHLPATTSVLAGAVPQLDCTITDDQRNEGRPQGDCEIGAVEIDETASTPQAPRATPTPATPRFTG